MLDFFLDKPEYHEVIKRSTGLLSPDERRIRINKIAEKNILLACKCKNTSFKEENDILCDLLIASIESKEDFLVVVIALVELGEHVIASDYIQEKLYNYQWGFHRKMIGFCLNESINSSEVLGEIARYLPAEYAFEFSNILQNSGYIPGVKVYNKLISISEAEIAREYFEEMRISGIEPDAETYYQMYKHEKTMDSSVFFKYFDKATKNENRIVKFKNRYLPMLKQIKDYDEFMHRFNMYLVFFPEKSSQKKVKVFRDFAYQLLKLSPNLEILNKNISFLEKDLKINLRYNTKVLYLSKISDKEIFLSGLEELFTYFDSLVSDSSRRKKVTAVSKNLTIILEKLILWFDATDAVCRIFLYFQSLQIAEFPRFYHYELLYKGNVESNQVAEIISNKFGSVQKFKKFIK